MGPRLHRSSPRNPYRSTRPGHTRHARFAVHLTISSLPGRQDAAHDARCVNNLPLEEVVFAYEEMSLGVSSSHRSTTNQAADGVWHYGAWTSERSKIRVSSRFLSRRIIYEVHNTTYDVSTHQALGHHSFPRAWRPIQQQVSVGCAVLLGVSRRYSQG